MRLPEAVARDRFGSAPVVRLATADGAGRPHIVVATFVLVGDQIYMAVDEKPKTTRRLRRLQNIAVNAEVALLADYYEDNWSALWWVRADGHAEIVSDPERMREPLRHLVERYPQYADAPPRGPVIIVTVDRWTGWAAEYASGEDLY